MIKVYCDRGAKIGVDGGVVSVAFVAFRRTEYLRFCRQWKRLLRPWSARAFHATDFYVGAGAFIRESPEQARRFEEDSRSIPATIGQHATYVLVVSFRPDEVRRVAPRDWQLRFGTSWHALSIQLGLIAMGWWARERGYCAGFEYFMESGDEDEPRVLADVGRMRVEHAETSRHVQVKCFTPIAKGSAPGLEAADFVAWHWNKHYIDRIRTSRPPRRDFAAFLSVVQEKIDIVFLEGRILRLFLSLTGDAAADGPVIFGRDQAQPPRRGFK